MLFLFLTLRNLSLAAATFNNTDCLDCHLDPTTTRIVQGKTVALLFPTNTFARSVHAKLYCVDCHQGIKDLVHESKLPAPNCGNCHDKAAREYNASVHGVSHTLGTTNAANCWSCHGGHDILPPTMPASPLYFTRQAETCGGCHPSEALDVIVSVHGKATAKGRRDAPTCTDCHFGHGIQSLKNRSSLEISEKICSTCHASERLNTKYRLPSDRVKTFFASYHGLAAQYGSTLAANCGSCHGAHKILPSSDPDSTIHKSHLVATCGKCHPGANEKFALGKIHVNPSTEADGGTVDAGGLTNSWVRRIYLVLIFGTIGTMLLHNVLLFYKKASAHLRAGGRRVVRMTLSQRWQHAVLALSFVALALTGFALKFPDSWLARALGSNEPLRRWAHRIAGTVLLVAGVYHLIYIVATRDGRRLVRDLFPIRKDLADLWRSARYLTGLSKQKPAMGRFGYAEKMEYWAVVWGTIIMGATGLMIWFKMDVTRFVPRWAVDVALTIHYYEAVLACLAIVVWHFYHVIFDPDVYPLNTACLDGKVSASWQAEEHPLEKTAGNIQHSTFNSEQ
jgi:formate dehydrogenase gamma subunit